MDWEKKLLINLKNYPLDTKKSFYIGDSKKDVDAAKSAGISSIACTYGYIYDSTNPKDWKADFYVDNALEILDVI